MLRFDYSIIFMEIIMFLVPWLSSYFLLSLLFFKDLCKICEKANAQKKISEK